MHCDDFCCPSVSSVATLPYASVCYFNCKTRTVVAGSIRIVFRLDINPCLHGHRVPCFEYVHCQLPARGIAEATLFFSKTLKKPRQSLVGTFSSRAFFYQPEPCLLNFKQRRYSPEPIMQSHSSPIFIRCSPR